MKSTKSLARYVSSLVLAISLTLGSGVAQAAGGYFGLAFGQGESAFDTESVVLISGPFLSEDSKDSSWKFFAGYQINENVAVEGAYVDFNKASVVADNAGFVDDYEADVTGFEFAAVGFLPVENNFSLFGKAGMILWNSDITVCLDTDATPTVTQVCASGSESGNDLLVGVGAKYNIGKSYSLRAEYTLYDIDKREAGAGHHKVISLGAAFHF